MKSRGTFQVQRSLARVEFDSGICRSIAESGMGNIGICRYCLLLRWRFRHSEISSDTVGLKKEKEE